MIFFYCNTHYITNERLSFFVWGKFLVDFEINNNSFDFRKSNVYFYCLTVLYFEQINLKGLDGIQGPVYVGTGCCFNRQALYGYHPVLTESDLEPNIIIKSCCGSRKKSKKHDKQNNDKKMEMKRTESTTPLFNLDDINEGYEGLTFIFNGFVLWVSLMLIVFFFFFCF